MSDSTTADLQRDELVKALRERGFYATHSDRWNDEAWQHALWNDLANAVLSSDWLRERDAQVLEQAEKDVLASEWWCESGHHNFAARIRNWLRDRATAYRQKEGRDND